MSIALTERTVSICVCQLEKINIYPVTGYPAYFTLSGASKYPVF